VDNPDAVLRAIAGEEYDLLLMDLNYTRDTTSGEEGLDLLSRLRTLPASPPVVVMTAWGSLETAVEAMRRGARDFVLKPWDNAKLLETVRTLLNAAPPPLEFDLQIARQVQSRLLPAMPRQGRTIRLDGYCRPIGAVGGDYFDVFDLATHHIGFVLADISGKGVAAALLMAHLQASLRSLAWQAGQNLAVYLRTINLQFRESTRPEHFATLFFGDYDDDARVLRYANCGHNPPFLFRAGAPVEQLQPTATVIGLLPEFRPEIAEISLAPGDRIAVYSDGISDAVPESQLPELLRRQRAPRETVEAVPNPQDDCTLLIADIQ
jgi:sigma-B regulation protein RsbU (phosphoserine phosphatase)